MRARRVTQTLILTHTQAWSQLGKMSGVEAMRLYVRTLDEEQVCACGCVKAGLVTLSLFCCFNELPHSVATSSLLAAGLVRAAPG